MADNAHIMVFHVITQHRIIGSYICCAVSVKCSASVFNSRKRQVVQVADKVSGQKVKGINLVLRQGEMRVQSETTRVKKNFSSSKIGEKYDLTYAISHTKGREGKG